MFAVAPDHWAKAIWSVYQKCSNHVMDKKGFTLINSILVYVLVKFQEFIFFPMVIRVNVSIISGQPLYTQFTIELLIISTWFANPSIT